ncbi:uncharacterized protein [Dermacentor albipictus]
MSVGSLLAYALIVMTCTAKGERIQVTAQSARNMRGHEVEQCQYTEFSRRREECNKNVNFLASRKGHDCHVMQIYVDCLTMALRNTGCTTNPFFLTSESNLIRRKVRDKNLTCDLYSDLLILQEGSESSCLRVRAVKLFFKCGTAFHFHIEGKSLTPGTICELLKTYVECGNVALKDTNCTNDETLQAHMGFFLRQSLQKHSLNCPNITSHKRMSSFLKGAPRAAFKVQHWAMANSEYGNADKYRNKERHLKHTEGCAIEDALRRYFTCGSNFLWKMVIWKRHFAKHQHVYNLAANETGPTTPSLRMLARKANEDDEVCGVIKQLQECTNEIISHSECKNVDGLSTKMLTMREILIGDSAKSACKFLNKEKHAIYSSYSKQNLPPPGCSYRKLVKLFSYCVVNFFSSFAMAKDTVQACMFLGRHRSCVQQARKLTNCSMKVKELEDFVYLTNVVQDKYSSRCKPEDKKTLAEKKAEAGVPSLCKKKSLLQKYLKCSFTLQNKLSVKIDECRALDSFSQCFMEARADNECTYTDDSFTSMMQMQTELMTDTLRSRCTQKSADLNVLLKCAQPDALKKMLLCGLSYNKLMEDLKRQGEYYVTSTTCSYLAEYQHCMIDVERTTGCTKSTLHEHTSAILNFWTWNVAPLCESAASLLLTDVDPKCDYPKSLLKALQCTIEFQEFAEQATWDTMTSAESCSSLEMLEKCLIHSLDNGQCKHSLHAKAQVSVLRSLLMAEYKVTCRKVYQSAPGMSEMQPDDYVYEDYYYFGDEVVRTRAPEKRPDHLLEEQLSNETRIAPSARLKLHDHLERIYNKVRGFGFDKIMNRVKHDPQPPNVPVTTPTAAFNMTNSSDEQQPQSAMTGVVIPVLDNDDGLCNMAGYEREKQRCSQYISDQARKYKRNIKYIPVSNLRDIADNVCKMVDLYRACMSEIAERNKCLVMLANTPRIVENELIKLGLTFCTTATIGSGCQPRYNAGTVTVVFLCSLSLRIQNWE